MRLHALRMSAFGPFAGTETVDFDALAADGLFLLRGATGAGKTSVLDAVCFALYGSVPGSRPTTRLRSDHARPEVRTEVVLELTLGGRRLEITRSPEQRRAKKRGEGWTVDKAQTLLREWSAEEQGWRASSKSHQEVGAELQQLIGMSREQFCQVVLLPQGEFARFLHSGAQERAELLRQLFGTGRFRAVEGWLAEHRQRTEKSCQAVQGEIGARLERLRQAAGVDLPPPEDADGALVWSALLREQAREEAAVAGSAHTGAAARRDAAAARAREVEVLADRQQRHRRAAGRAAELRAEAPAHRADAERLERAQRAEAVAPLLRLHRQAVLTERQLLDAERQCRALLPEPLAALGVEALSAAERESREELGALRTLLSAEERFGANEQQQKRLEAEREDAEARRTEAEEWLAQWPALRQQTVSVLERAQQSAVRARQLEEQLADAGRRVEAAGQAEALGAQLASATGREAELRRIAATAHESWLRLLEQRLRGMAAELAEGLRPGGDCPVCGSAEHPRPAVAGPDRVTPEQEQRAEQEYRQAERRSQDAGLRLQELGSRVAALTAVAGELPADRLREAAARLEAEYAQEQQGAAAGVGARERLDRLEAEHDRRAAEASAAVAASAARTARLEEIEDRQRELAAELARFRSSSASVADRVAELERTAERITGAAAAARSALDAARTRERAAETALAAAEREGFDGLAAAGEALLPPDRLAALRVDIDRHRTELDRVEAQLADQELIAADRLPTADPAADRAALDAAEAALRRAFAVLSAAGERCAELDRLSRGLAVELRRLAPLAAEHTTAAGLASLAAGTSRSNELKMSLETYVLAARLEQVAAAAGARLALMSQGRYTLAHSDARAKGGARSGLGLSVLDAWTGLHRDTSTLSGGESFFASLALALGLADVVTDEAGGMPLDTLFIDEGFGSLDEDTLEDVLDVLDRLRERDRAVGIVSHVADLRSRIPAQLEVRKGRSGSTLRRLGSAGGPNG
jgi:exonuclease SbcC